MHNTEAAAVFLAVIGSSYVLYKAMSTYMATPSAVYTLRGPDSSSWISGHTQIIRAPYPHDHTFDRWIREYGTTFPVQGFFGGKGLLMTDTRAVAFILTHPAEFSKVRIVIQLQTLGAPLELSRYPNLIAKDCPEYDQDRSRGRLVECGRI